MTFSNNIPWMLIFVLCYALIQKVIQKYNIQKSKRLEECPKHAGWGGVCLPCAQHAAVQSKSEDADKRDFKIRGTSESSLQPSLESVTAPSWLFIVFRQVMSFWFLPFDLQGFVSSAEIEILDMREKEGKRPFFTRAWGTGRIFIPTHVKIKHIFISPVICICLTYSLKAL